MTFAAVTMMEPSMGTSQENPKALDFQMKTIDGEDVSLSKYAGKVVVFVNVASQCGFTRQYKQLQELHANYADKGVAVVGVPCNQFGGQEPGTPEEIVEFCQKNYGVEFDLLSKVDVKGKGQTGLYKYLTNLDLAPKGKGDVRWNFEKFVLDKSGKPIARFASNVKPDSDEFMSVIKKSP
jgi:glutathione peroxidase